MGKDRSEDLTARVVAWHNRHPLAERISALHVQSMGWVAVPFVAGAEASAETSVAAAGAEGAAGEAGEAAPQSGAADSADAAGTADLPVPGRRRRGWKPAFSEDFIAPLTPRQVARFALRHGRTQAPEDGLPVREVQTDPALAGATTPTMLWLQTAAIERGASRLRLLLAPDAALRAIGPRHGSASRRIFAGTFAAVALTAALASLWPDKPHGHVMLAAAPAASAAPATSAASAARPPPAAASGGTLMAAAPLPSAASAASAAGPAIAEPAAVADAANITHMAEATNAAQTAEAAVAAVATPKATESTRRAAAAPPPPVALAAAPRRLPEVRGPKGVRPNLGLQLDDDAKARARIAVLAAREAREAREARDRRLASQRAASSPGSTPATRPALLAAASAASAALPSGGAAPAERATWAVATRSIRTRFESEQMLAAMRAVASKDSAASALHFDVVPAGEDWRAISWPFAERQEAERVRLALQERGLRVQVVPF